MAVAVGVGAPSTVAFTVTVASGEPKADGVTGVVAVIVTVSVEETEGDSVSCGEANGRSV